MENSLLVDLMNLNHRVSLTVTNEVNNVSSGDIVKELDSLVNTMKELSDKIKKNRLEQDNHSDMNSRYIPVTNEEDDDIMVGDISTNSTVVYSPTLSEGKSVESRCKKCQVFVKRITVNNTRTKPCTVALKRLRMSNMLEIHKLELVGQDWTSEDKEHKNSSTKYKRQKVDWSSVRKCSVKILKM